MSFSINKFELAVDVVWNSAMWQKKTGLYTEEYNIRLVLGKNKVKVK